MSGKFPDTWILNEQAIERRKKGKKTGDGKFCVTLEMATGIKFSSEKKVLRIAVDEAGKEALEYIRSARQPEAPLEHRTTSSFWYDELRKSGGGKRKFKGAQQRRARNIYIL